MVSYLIYHHSFGSSIFLVPKPVLKLSLFLFFISPLKKSSTFEFCCLVEVEDVSSIFDDLLVVASVSCDDVAALMYFLKKSESSSAKTSSFFALFSKGVWIASV